jgi:hypothetical protein
VPTSQRLEPVTQENVRAACRFAPEHDNPIFHSHLWRLNIGAEYQGEGYGRFAVEEVCHETMRRRHR